MGWGSLGSILAPPPQVDRLVSLSVPSLRLSLSPFYQKSAPPLTSTQGQPRVSVLVNGCTLLSLGGAPRKDLSLWIDWFALWPGPSDRSMDVVPGGAAVILLINNNNNNNKY